MKIKRYMAVSMRAALAQVRAEQGPDAVILSSRRVAEGIEVIAAVDYDEALFVGATLRRAPLAPAETPEIPTLMQEPVRDSVPQATAHAVPQAVEQVVPQAVRKSATQVVPHTSHQAARMASPPTLVRESVPVRMQDSGFLADAAGGARPA